MNDPEPALDFYDALLERMQPKLYGYILSLVASPADAKDVLQESNRVILRKVGELRQADRFNAWSFKIAYYQSLSFLKKRKNEKLRFDDSLLQNVASASETVADESERTYQRLEGCIARLQGKTRSIVSDFYYYSLPIKEIAAKRELAGNHIAQILYRARKALHECMIQSEKNDDE